MSLLDSNRQTSDSFEERLTLTTGQDDPPVTDLEYYAKPENYHGSNLNAIQRVVFAKKLKDGNQSPDNLDTVSASASLKTPHNRLYITEPRPIYSNSPTSTSVSPSSPILTRNQTSDKPIGKVRSGSATPERVLGRVRLDTECSRFSGEFNLDDDPDSRIATNRILSELNSPHTLSRTSIYSYSSLPTSKDRSKSAPQRRMSRRITSSHINWEKEWRSKMARERFRHVVRMVILMQKWVSSFSEREVPEDRMQTFTDLANEYRAEELKNAGLSFDVSYFKANREINISNEVKYILCLPPGQRSPEQLQTVLYGLQHLKSFAEYPLHMQEKLCKVAWYEVVPPKRVIIRQGHLAENFYFILSGHAVVRITEKNAKTGEVQSRTATIMRKGMSFGELALLHHSRRTATVVSQDGVQLLTIGRADFFDIFMSGQGPGEIPEHIKFITSLEWMKEWPIQRLLSHPEHCLFHFFKRGVVIVKDSLHSDWLYIVKSGTCQVMKELRPVTPKLGFRTPSPPASTVVRFPDLGFGEIESRLYTGKKKSRVISVTSPIAKAIDEFEHSKARHPREAFKTEVSQQQASEEHTEDDNYNTHKLRNGYSNGITGQNGMQRTTGFSRSRYDAIILSTKKGNLNSIPITTITVPSRKKTPPIKIPKENRQPVFVQVELLKPRDVFGLTTIQFENEADISQTSVSLVSRGAECIMLSKKFFIQNSNEKVRRSIRHNVRPYPEDGALQENLQTKVDWDLYKDKLIETFVENRKLIQSLKVTR